MNLLMAIPVRGAKTAALVNLSDAPQVSGHLWSRDPMGYAYRVEYGGGKKNRIIMHRVIAHTPSDLRTDHRNGDTLDNRSENLRACTQADNVKNCRKRNTPTASQFKGVDRKNGKWRARLRLNKRAIQLGYFTDEKQAALAYDAAARKHFGEFARPNFPMA